MDTRIYVMTHKHYHAPADSLYHTLHVGRAISEDLGYDGDHTGDNISAKNKSYCELTGIYWLWKNIHCDIIGICHYRRYFMYNDKLITKPQLESLLSDYDILLPNSGTTNFHSLKEQYARCHHVKDLAIARDVIKELAPNYLDAFDHVLSCNLFSLGNMIITRKGIYDEYCDWLFPLLFEMEKRIDTSTYDNYQARIWGFISERLLRVWLTMQSYRVKELSVTSAELADGYETLGIKKAELTYRKIQLLMGDVLHQFQTNTPPPFNLQPTLRSNEKIPVWICWWQGPDAAPDIVTLCIQSAIRHIPQDIAEIHLITLENYKQYVTFPDYIMEKFHQGKISYTHLSDILRASLLFIYGGLWVDATYYFASDVPKSILLDGDFYTIRLQKAPWEADIVQGRWADNFIRVQKGNKLYHFLLSAFYNYWSKFDDVIDYYLMGYLIALAYDHIPGIRDQIDACDYSNPHVLDLQGEMNRPYEKCSFSKYCEDTFAFKLNHRFSYETKTPDGRLTLFGKLIEQEFGLNL